MWTLDPDQPVPAWRPDAPDPVTCLAFSTRRGGASAPPFDTMNLGRSTADLKEAVDENRRRLLTACHLSPGGVATAGQVHGSRVIEVTRPGHHPDCDALLTRSPGIALCVTTADCLPLLYVAPGVVAAAHSGWRGTADGMPRATLNAVVVAAGVAADDVRVHLGPCIRSCCYEVGAEVARRFPAGAVSRVEESWRLDLATAARLQLLDAGVPLASISDVGACTSCEPHWYFSHRRDAGRTGRHWAIVARLTA
jgi:polyphenol oxidase